MTFFVGLAGPAKVGKSTTANKLVQIIKEKRPELKIKASAFAEPLYDLCSFITGVPSLTLMDQSYKQVPWTNDTAPLPCLIDWTPRKLLQIIGTEGFRTLISQNFWVELAVLRNKEYDIVIMADARFDTEYQICNFVIELFRNGIEYAENHPSAMKPDPKYIDYKLTLFSDIDLTNDANLILDLYQGEINARTVV